MSAPSFPSSSTLPNLFQPLDVSQKLSTRERYGSMKGFTQSFLPSIAQNFANDVFSNSLEQIRLIV